MGSREYHRNVDASGGRNMEHKRSHGLKEFTAEELQNFPTGDDECPEERMIGSMHFGLISHDSISRNFSIDDFENSKGEDEGAEEEHQHGPHRRRVYPKGERRLDLGDRTLEEWKLRSSLPTQRQSSKGMLGTFNVKDPPPSSK